MAKKKSAPAPLIGEWICKKVAYERSDEMLARGIDDDDERQPESAKNTEFKLASAVVTDKGRFEVRAPGIMSAPIATGSFKKKGKSLMPTTESLSYGRELVGLRQTEKTLEFVLRLDDDSYDTHDLLVLVFGKGGGDQSALFEELATLDSWDQADFLRNELDGDEDAISELLWGAFSRGELSTEGDTSSLLVSFPSASTVEQVVQFFERASPAPDCELAELLRRVPEGWEPEVAGAMGAEWLEDLAQTRMLMLTDERFFAERRRAFFPPAFDQACLEYAKRDDSLNLEAIRAISIDPTDRIRALVRYIGPNRFDALVEACDAMPKEAAIAALTPELASKVPHHLLNAIHALGTLGFEVPSDRRDAALAGITTYTLFGKFTRRDFEVLQKLGVNTAALSIGVTAD